ncbi:hypothetical protein OAF85_01370, partial [Planctomycetota bacterium]|nr:hypothetical protein [Planctomycetota bacterium]
LAPNSAPGDTGGLKLTANDTAGAGDAWTLFHTNPVAADFYVLHVDVWMNFTSGSGTTEFSEVGVGGDGVTYNSVFSPISGSGAFIAFTGDGGSSSDFRWFRAVPNTPMGETDNTTLPNSHPSYLGHGSNGSGSFFQSLFPAPPSTTAGSPGNIWTTVRIEVDNLGGQISFYFDDQLTFQGDFANDFNGFASLSIADVFTSVSTANNFTLYDNFRVEVPTNTVGSNYCSAAVNSTGATGAVFAVGSEFASDNLVRHEVVRQRPPHELLWLLPHQYEPGLHREPRRQPGQPVPLRLHRAVRRDRSDQELGERRDLRSHPRSQPDADADRSRERRRRRDLELPGLVS